MRQTLHLLQTCQGMHFFIFLHVRCRGHLGRGRVRCQRRHLSIACDISSGRRADVPAKKAGALVPARLANTSLGFDSGRFSGFAEVCTLCKCIHSIQTLCWTRTSRLGLNCSGAVATQAVCVYIYIECIFYVFCCLFSCLLMFVYTRVR